MRKFWKNRWGLLVLVGVALAVAAVLHAQPPGGGGPGGGGPGGGGFMNRMAMGTVESVNGNQIVVKGMDGQSRTVVVGEQGTIIRFAKGTKEDLKEKAVVQVRGQYDQNRAWFLPRVVQVGEGIEGGPGGPGGRGMLTGVGQIYSIKDNQIYLTLPLVVSDETQIVRGDKIQPGQVQAGENLFAFGEPGENNTLNATRVTVGDQQAMMMAGGMMLGGPGGFGGGRGGPGGRGGGRGGQQ